MKRLSLAAALIIGATTTLTFAQTAAEVAKPKCEPKPVLPGSRMMQEQTIVKRFQADLDQYKKCMNDYLEERKATIKANEVAANAAIEDYNGTMKALADAQKAR